MSDSQVLSEEQAAQAAVEKGYALDLASLDNPKAMKLYRRFDGVIILVLFAFITLGVQIQYTLTAGDWDYWADWRDRRWWPLVSPNTLLVLCGAFTYGIWVRLRLPIIATAVTILLVLVGWISRYLNFYEFTFFPMSFTFPSTYIGVGIILDCVLVITRSLVVTAVVGAYLFSFLVWPLNWPVFAATKVPVEYNGMLMSVADVMGFEYIRTTTPEYLRIIEESTLRNLGGSVTPLTAVFSGVVGIVVYSLFLGLGAAINRLDIYARRII